MPRSANGRMKKNGSSMSSYRLGIDIGGTFTDLVLLGADGSVHVAKIVSTPPDFGVGVVRGLHIVLDDAKISPPQLRVLSTARL